jgi:hypothetical protein
LRGIIASRLGDRHHLDAVLAQLADGELLPHVIQAATVTPSGLLSGKPDKQKDKGARGGLLRQIDGFGGFGIICLKDFGSVLSMHAETRAETLAALREVYDGSWTRHLGSAGGKTLSWKGKGTQAPRLERRPRRRRKFAASGFLRRWLRLAEISPRTRVGE